MFVGRLSIYWVVYGAKNRVMVGKITCIIPGRIECELQFVMTRSMIVDVVSATLVGWVIIGHIVLLASISR